jgi:DNA-binding CsgD family transcriptional regulator
MEGEPVMAKKPGKKRFEGLGLTEVQQDIILMAAAGKSFATIAMDLPHDLSKIRHGMANLATRLKVKATNDEEKTLADILKAARAEGWPIDD